DVVGPHLRDVAAQLVDLPLAKFEPLIATGALCRLRRFVATGKSQSTRLLANDRAAMAHKVLDHALLVLGGCHGAGNKQRPVSGHVFGHEPVTDVVAVAGKYHVEGKVAFDQTLRETQI